MAKLPLEKAAGAADEPKAARRAKAASAADEPKAARRAKAASAVGEPKAARRAKAASAVGEPKAAGEPMAARTTEKSKVADQATNKPGELEMPESAQTTNHVANGMKVLGEIFLLPGSSLILDGDVKRGGAHAIVGLAAKALLGPAGAALALVAAANSYSTSVAGKDLKTLLSSES